MIESYAFSNVGVVEDGIDGGLGRGAWDDVGRGKVKIPETGAGGAFASENGVALMLNGNFGGREVGDAAVITELANRNEGTGGELWEEMGLACSWG